jgi:hypothetical protein
MAVFHKITKLVKNNALGTECIIKASDKSIYTTKLSIYSYSNDINTCKCQAGYEFSLSASGEELSKKGGSSSTDKPGSLGLILNIRLQTTRPPVIAESKETGLPGLLGETPNVIENDYQPLPVNWDNVSTSPTEYENISLNSIPRNTPINTHDALGNQIQDIYSEEHINVNAQNVLPDNEVADSSRGLISSTRSPAPEGIYDEIC